MRALAVGAAALMVLGWQQPPGQSSNDTRTVEIIVHDDQMRPVTQLRSDDVTLAVDRVPRVVEAITRAEDPLSMVLLVDMSQSMTYGADLPESRGSDWWGTGVLALFDGIEGALPRRLPSGDRARIGRFAGGMLALSERLTADPDELKQAARRVLTLSDIDVDDRKGPSPTMDAVARTAATLANERGRRAVLLFTDGESSGNRRSLENTARELAALGVPVHVMMEVFGGTQDRGVFNRSRFPSDYQPDRLMRPLAAMTGGLLLQDDRQTRTSWGFTTPAPPFERLFAVLHSAYRLSFSAAGVSDDATVEVTSKNPKHRVHAARWLRAR